MKHYDKAHKIAKSIVFCTVVVLLIFSRVTGLLLIDILAVACWFWLTNPCAYVIESLLHFKHEHERF